MKWVMITDYWKGEVGGIATYLTNLVPRMEDKGAEVRIIYRNGMDTSNLCIKGNDIAFSIKAFFSLLKINPDVIHGQSSWYCFAPGILYKLLRKRKVIFTFHTKPEKKSSLPVRLFFQWMINNSDSVTFVSKGLKKMVEEIEGYHFTNGQVVYGGAPDVAENDQEDIERFFKNSKINRDSHILLGLGLTALKEKAEGAKLLIAAAKIVSEEYPDIVLILTKEGRYSKELKQFARGIGASELVIFTGDIDNPGLALGACDIYTHISLSEGLPMAVLEAMKIGKPIIANPIGGIPEAIVDGHNGLLVNLDAIEIAEKIKYVLNNDKIAKELGKNALVTANRDFTWEKSAETYLGL